MEFSEPVLPARILKDKSVLNYPITFQEPFDNSEYNPFDVFCTINQAYNELKFKVLPEFNSSKKNRQHTVTGNDLERGAVTTTQILTDFFYGVEFPIPVCDVNVILIVRNGTTNPETLDCPEGMVPKHGVTISQCPGFVKSIHFKDGVTLSPFFKIYVSYKLDLSTFTAFDPQAIKILQKICVPEMIYGLCDCDDPRRYENLKSDDPYETRVF
tara:strand:+ start:45825 stop:46463 length:639 start_codon:yes stop_codon:yes gene_type:complete